MMRSLSGVYLACMSILSIGCHASMPVSESLEFRFRSADGKTEGGFVCYPSAHEGWLCESAAGYGADQRAVHVDAEVDSLHAMFSLVKDAAAVVDTSERVAAREKRIAQVERLMKQPLGTSLPTLEVMYVGGGREESLCIDGGSMKIAEAMEVHAELTRFYRQAIGSVGAASGPWFRELTPTEEEVSKWRIWGRFSPSDDEKQDAVRVQMPEGGQEPFWLEEFGALVED